ncbi:MAG: type IV pilin protein [Gammaproteobacteria bacterium]
MLSHTPNLRRNHGFTLIELMTVVAILSLISIVAVPAYLNYARKAKRTDAVTLLQEAASKQERYYTTNNSYAKSMSQLGYSSDPVSTSSKAYTVSVTNVTPAGCTGLAGANACFTYTLTAAPVGSQGNDDCGSFTLNYLGTKGLQGNSPSVTVQDCWR